MHWAHVCRAEILRVHLRRCPTAPDVDVCALAARSAGYSGADLAAVVREAGLAALEEDLGAQQVGVRVCQVMCIKGPPACMDNE